MPRLRTKGAKEHVQLGQRIRQEREAAGVQVGRLAKLIGIDASVLRRIETGEVTASAARLRAIAFELGISVARLHGEIPANAER